MADSNKNKKNYNWAYPEPFNKIPPPVLEKKPGQLSEEQIRQFFEEGYTVVKDFFTKEELQACRDDIDQMVDHLANKLYEAGKIKHLHKEAGLFQRLTKLEEEFKGANILLFKHQKIPKELAQSQSLSTSNVERKRGRTGTSTARSLISFTKPRTRLHVVTSHPVKVQNILSFRDLWCNKRLLNAIEQLIGPDIAGHPVWNMRTKTPNSIALDVPWHQDSGYFSEESYDHLVPTAWIPFLDATAENGCLQMVRYGHKKGKMAKHTCCISDTWFITLDEKEMEDTLGVDIKKDVVTVPIPYGGFLLFSNIIPHRSLANVSNDVRWSIDLRWQSPYENWGFYDIAEGILFRTARDGDVTPDWDKFLSVDRKEVWQKKYYKQVVETDHFDTTVTGPWIGRWEITNRNKHTKAFTSAAS